MSSSSGRVRFRDDRRDEPLFGDRVEQIYRGEFRRIVTNLESVVVQIRLDRFDTLKP